MAKPPIVFVLNGPNLNMLGQREPSVYGRTTLAEVEKLCRERAEALGLAVDFRQTNHEGELVGWIQEARSALRAGRGLSWCWTRGRTFGWSL